MKKSREGHYFMVNTITSSAIYEGQVRHQRFLPVQHDFQYRLFMMFLNLDELDEIFQSFWLWSTQKANVAYLKRSDHLGPENLSLKAAATQFILDKTGYQLQGDICLLTHLRYWGYCFNPVSFYYCYDKTNQQVEWILAEINNTPWGERHCYLLKTQACSFEGNSANYISDTQEKGTYHFAFNKDFHISPLMPMDAQHDWWIKSPARDLMIHMNNYSGEKKMFTAHMSLARQAITHKNMAKTLLNYPFMTGKVIASIYWQALRTKLKGAIFYPHPKN